MLANLVLPAVASFVVFTVVSSKRLIPRSKPSRENLAYGSYYRGQLLLSHQDMHSTSFLFWTLTAEGQARVGGEGGGQCSEGGPNDQQQAACSDQAGRGQLGVTRLAGGQLGVMM